MVESAVPLHARLTFEPSDGGTPLAFRTYGQLTGAMRVLQPVLRRPLRRQFAEHCDTLKRVLETTP
jgi:hypothetical protein